MAHRKRSEYDEHLSPSHCAKQHHRQKHQVVQPAQDVPHTQLNRIDKHLPVRREQPLCGVLGIQYQQAALIAIDHSELCALLLFAGAIQIQ